MNIRKYWHVWWTSSKLSAQSAFASRGGALMFMFGKFLRFGFFIYFLFILSGNVKTVANYDFQVLLTFFLVFNLFDLFGQLFFRGIYWFRQQVISGEFDFRLVKPISPLFQALTRQTDILDIPLLVVVIVALVNQGIEVGLSSMVLFILMSTVSIMLITSFHIVIASLGVLTTEVDHTVLIYRDLSLMARLPIDIYIDSIRALLTFAIPVAIVFSFPAKAILGLLTLKNIIIAMGIGLVFFVASHKFWRFALTKYSSASS